MRLDTHARPAWWRDPGARATIPLWPLVLGGTVWRGRSDFNLHEGRDGEAQDRDALATDYWGAALDLAIPFVTPQLADYGIPDPVALELMERHRPGVVAAFFDRSEARGRARRAWESMEFTRRTRAYFAGMGLGACALGVVAWAVVVGAGPWWVRLGGPLAYYLIARHIGIPACPPRGACVASLLTRAR